MKRQLPHPQCAKCGRLVERVTELQAGDGLFDQRIRYVFECHGEREEVTLDRRELADAFTVELGACFVQRPALPDASEPG